MLKLPKFSRFPWKNICIHWGLFLPSLFFLGSNMYGNSFTHNLSITCYVCMIRIAAFLWKYFLNEGLKAFIMVKEHPIFVSNKEKYAIKACLFYYKKLSWFYLFHIGIRDMHIDRNKILKILAKLNEGIFFKCVNCVATFCNNLSIMD